MDALLKDSEHLAALIDNVSSVDNLDFIMESDALRHTVMDQRQGHESLVAVAGTVTLEEVFGSMIILLISSCCTVTRFFLAVFLFLVCTNLRTSVVISIEYKYARTL